MLTPHDVRILLAKRFAWGHKLHMLRSVNQNKKRSRGVLSELQEKGANTATLGKVLAKSRNRILQKGSRVCHVIGSGASVHDSIEVIDNKDFCIGFNYSGLLPINFDLYFVEFGGESNEYIARQHAAIVDAFISPTTDLVFFKNIAEDKNDIESMMAMWGKRCAFMVDYLVPCEDVEHLNYTLQYCLNQGKGDFLPQYSSTAITSIFMAVYLGFDAIVLHGVDFGGFYFYEDPRFDGDRDLTPLSNNSGDGLYARTYSAATPHVTARGGLGLKESIAELAKILGTRGCKLMSASRESGSSQMLSIYRFPKASAGEIT